MCIDMRIGMCMDMYIGMCRDMRTDMCMDMRTDMCADTCTEMCVDMCDMRIDLVSYPAVVACRPTSISTFKSQQRGTSPCFGACTHPLAWRHVRPCGTYVCTDGRLARLARHHWTRFRRRGGHFEHGHAHTHAMDMPLGARSAMPMGVARLHDRDTADGVGDGERTEPARDTEAARAEQREVERERSERRVFPSPRHRYRT